MPVIVASKAGFCSGVTRAVNSLLQEAGKTCGGSTLGPIVHNDQVVDYLKECSVTVVNNPGEAEGSFIAVRTHGVTPEKLKELNLLDHLRVLDLTCPRVSRVQEIAAALSEKGINVIIFGNQDHPEVKGLIGWAGGDAKVISSPEELELLAIELPSALIAQTTSNPGQYEQVKKLYMEKDPEGQYFDTLCPEIRIRQKEAEKLAQRVEALVVVGSETSANTQALFDCCRQLKPSCRVTNAGELDRSFLRQYRVIGVTAGASTPPWTIKEVVESMEKENQEVQSVELDEEQKEIMDQKKIETEDEAQEEEQAQLQDEERVEEQKEVVAEEEVQPEAQKEVQEEEQTAAPDEEEIEEQTAAQGEAEETDQTAPDEEKEEEQTETQSEADETAETEAPPEEQLDYNLGIKEPQVGEQVSGKVARVTDEEVYVDIGAKTEAILPAGEVHLDRGQVLADLFAPEDDVEVTVLETDEQEDKVIVSHKRLARDKRLKELEDALESQEILEGEAKQVVSAGILVDLGAGIEGFMPGSLVDTRYIPDFNEFKGQKIKFKILEYDREKGKLILTRRKIMEEETSMKREEILNSLEVGSTITGTVKRLTDFGAFVDVGGIDGLVHISELSWERIGHPREILQVGDDVEVKVLEVIPEKERISLSIRKTQPDPWTKAIEDLKSDQVINGRVTRLTNFGAFIEIKPGVEGLAHISQLADYHVKHPSEILSEGEEVEVKVLEVKPKAKRISLSVKDAGGVTVVPGSTEGSGTENGNVTLGDVFGDLFDKSDYSKEETTETGTDEDSEQDGGEG